MSETIWKYQHVGQPGDVVAHAFPKGWRVQHVGVQLGIPTLWLIVDPDDEKETALVGVFGTGWALPEGWTPLGTYEQGTLVWHVGLLPSDSEDDS